MKRLAYKDYTEKIVKQKAIKCKTRTEFSKKYRSAYNWARDHGVLRKVCLHMPSGKWTEKTIETEAKKHKTIKSFRKNASGAYSRALIINKSTPTFLKKIFSHMIKDGTALYKHTKESAFTVAKQYKELKVFRKERRDVQAFLRRNGFYAEAIKHMKKKIPVSFKEILSVIKKYEYWDEFKDAEPKIFSCATQRTFWNKNSFVPKYIKERAHPLSWDKKMVLREMKKYKTRKKLLKYKPAAYQRAISLNLIEETIDPINKRKRWTKKNLLALCKKYEFLGALIINEGNAPLNAAKNLGITLPLKKVQYSGETYLKHFLEHILEMPLRKSRPEFLKNPRSGRNLELDGFNEEHKIAFEHSGRYHYKPHFSRPLEDIQYRDQLKKALCKKHKIKLIETQDLIFDYKMNEKRIKSLIKKQLVKLKVPYNKEKFNKYVIFNKKIKVNKKTHK